MTPVEAMQQELDRIHGVQASMITEHDRIKSDRKVEYNQLTRKAKEFFEAINQHRAWKEEGWNVSG